MFRAEDRERARKIVSELELPVEFGETEITCGYFEEQLMDVIGDEDFYVTSGVSKLVIVVESLPFVIKIPFNGQWEENYDDECEDDETFCRFENASDWSCDDYCCEELEMTNSMEENGFGALVPEMDYLCDVCGRSVYIQTKVIPMSEARKKISPSADSRKKAENYKGSFFKDWIALVYDTYGVGFWNAFVAWAREWQPEVLQDVHSGNYGIFEDGRPVMFDISGFRG